MYFEKIICDNIKFTEDVSFYPALSNSGSYRIHSETVATVDVYRGLGLRVSVIDDYDSDPANDAKKNDLQLLSSIVYAF